MKIIIATVVVGIAIAGCNTNRPIDPVCRMQMNKPLKWTDYSLFKGDTVWFCCENCKLLFEANTKMYETKINKDRARRKK